MACLSATWVLLVCLAMCLGHVCAAPLAFRRWSGHSELMTGEASAKAGVTAVAIAEAEGVRAGDALSFLQTGGVRVATAGSANSSLPASTAVTGAEASLSGSARDKPQPVVVAFASAPGSSDAPIVPPRPVLLATSFRSIAAQNSSNVTADVAQSASSYKIHADSMKEIHDEANANSSATGAGLEPNVLNSSEAIALRMYSVAAPAANETSPAMRSIALKLPMNGSVEQHPSGRRVQTVAAVMSNDTKLTLAMDGFMLAASALNDSNRLSANATASALDAVVDQKPGVSTRSPIGNNSSPSTLSNGMAVGSSVKANVTDTHSSSHLAVANADMIREPKLRLLLANGTAGHLVSEAHAKANMTLAPTATANADTATFSQNSATQTKSNANDTSNASAGRSGPSSQPGAGTNGTVVSLASTRVQPWLMPDEPVGSLEYPRPSTNDVTGVAVLVTGVSSRYVHLPVLEHIVAPAAAVGYPVDYYVRLVRRGSSQRASHIGDATDNPFFSNMTDEQLIVTVTEAAKQHGARNVSITILDEKETIQKAPASLARHLAYPEDVSNNVVRKFESLEWLWNQTRTSGNNYSQIVVARDDTVLLSDVNITSFSDPSRVYVPYCGKDSARYRPNDNVRVIGARVAAKVMPLYSAWETDPDQQLSGAEYAELFLKDVMEAKGVAYEESEGLSFFNGAFVHRGGSESATMCAQKPCNAHGLPLGVPTCVDPSKDKDAASF